MNVGERQRRLSAMVEQDPGIMFHDLYGHLWNRDWLRLAHDYVAQNAGSITAGCDGMTMKDFDRHLEANLECLREDLKTGPFTPYPVRRVYIPKASGRMRPLGIPSIRDRIVQEALRMVLEPIYEAEFSQDSFGFRPNRGTMDALKAIRHYTNERMKFFWILAGDLASYFDTINHRGLLKVLRRRVQDRRRLDLVWKFLRAGVMEKKLFRDTSQGTPQGGIATPPTKLPTFFFGVRIARVWIDSKHDVDLIPSHFHPLHQSTDPVPFAGPMGCLQAIVDFGGQVFEASHNQR